MPELPEVENVKLSLERQGVVGQTFARVDLLRKNLRTPLKRELVSRLPGQTIANVARRAKFLVFETEDYLLVSHLGMTGSWRLSQHEPILEKHDHVVLRFTSGLKLIFNDPRRFGLLELVSKTKRSDIRWFKHLGVEPLTETFTPDYLFTRTRKRKAPIKAFLMDQRQVVGVGNIYASEALYRAGVRPSRPAGRLTRNEAGQVVASVQQILKQAIASGGSTIRDYRNSEGTSGAFQTLFSVYDRATEPCVKCGASIRSRFIAGRNTFWCPKCQH